MNFTRLAEQKALIGKRVTAVGCCGTKDGIGVEGILHKVDNFGAVVLISHGTRIDVMPALVNGGTIREVKHRTHSEITDERFSTLVVVDGIGLMSKANEKTQYVVNGLGLNIRDVVVPKN